MAGKLVVASGLTLPLDAVTQTFGILGKRGGGKTYTAKVMAEEMLTQNAHICAIDPIGNWWGLRLADDGKTPAFPITVLGGDYGDLPIEPTEKAGELIARLIVEERVSTVVDVSRFRKGEQTHFMIGFAEALYRLNREALHLFIDEADAWAPQRPVGNLAPRLLGAMEDLVRRGRARGLGVTMITQRSASINKDLLTQIEVLIAKRTIAPQDREAVEAWVDAHSTKEQKKVFMDSLASLPVEKAWFWSPAWLNLFELVEVRTLTTFDSSATPEVGKHRRAPRRLDEVDLAKLQTRMAETIERAKAEDPALLRKEIAQLKAELNKKPKATAPAVDDKILRDSVERAFNEGVKAERKRHRNAIDVFDGEVTGLLSSLRQNVSGGVVVDPPELLFRAHARRPTENVERAIGRPVENSSNGTLTGPQQRIIDALAELEALGISPAENTQIAIFARYSPTSTSYTNPRGELNKAGMIMAHGSGLWSLSDIGRSSANPTIEAPTREEVQQRVLARLSSPQRRILQPLIEHYPSAVSNEKAAEWANYSPTSTSYTNPRGELRALGLIEFPDRGTVRATKVLFPGDEY